MKNIFAISLLVFTFYSFSQSDSIKKNQLGIFYSPNYCGYQFDGGYGYTTGLNYARKISNRISLNSGILFSNQADNQYNSTFGNLVGDVGIKDTTYTYRNKYQFIEIPLIVDFYFLQREKLNVFVMGGITANYFLGRKTSVEMTPTTGPIVQNGYIDNPVSSFSTFVFSASIGFGMEYKVNRDWNIIFEPEYTIYAPSKSFNFGIGGYMYSVGVNCGVTRNF